MYEGKRSAVLGQNVFSSCVKEKDPVCFKGGFWDPLDQGFLSPELHFPPDTGPYKYPFLPHLYQIKDTRSLTPVGPFPGQTSSGFIATHRVEVRRDVAHPTVTCASNASSHAR
ncbi:hypothetical protein FKM82_020066 [Ascaphus truei]